MTITARGSDDDFDKVEQGIDWLERLELIRARQDRESAVRETIAYVNRMRAALSALAGNADTSDLAARYGSNVANLVDDMRETGSVDPWTEYLMPSLLES